MVLWQRALGERRSIVGEGRDLGTVVFPQASYKFYLDADLKVRCQRRADELKAKGAVVDMKALEKDMAERDQHDLTRKVAPLKRADDARTIDSTNMTADQVIATIAKHIQSK
jgi:cytidylate kinase